MRRDSRTLCIHRTIVLALFVIYVERYTEARSHNFSWMEGEKKKQRRRRRRAMYLPCGGGGRDDKKQCFRVAHKRESVLLKRDHLNWTENVTRVERSSTHDVSVKPGGGKTFFISYHNGRSYWGKCNPSRTTSTAGRTSSRLNGNLCTTATTTLDANDVARCSATTATTLQRCS